MQTSLPNNEGEHVASINKVLAMTTLLSPVELLSLHIFFGKLLLLEVECQPLKSTIKKKQDTSTPNNPSTLNKCYVAVQAILLLPPIRSKEQQILKSSTESGYHALKSTINSMDINHKHSTTLALDNVPNGIFEQPLSLKSRNVSHMRQPVQQ